MLRSVLGSFGFIHCCVWISLLATGCGGASASGGGDSVSANDPGAAAAAQAAEDPKVTEAGERCESEKKKSELQPPDQLAPIMVHACIYAVRPEVAECTKGPKREVVVKIIVEKTGEVSNAFPIGDSADTMEAKCVAEAVKGVLFPKFKGMTQQVLKYPFTLGEE